MKITRVNLDENRFDVLADGKTVFYAEREFIKRDDGIDVRGSWLLFKPTNIGLLQVDRDRYSNDLVERCGVDVNGPSIYYTDFKKDCSKFDFNTKGHDWVCAVQDQFGGEWAARFDSFEFQIVFERKA